MRHRLSLDRETELLRWKLASWRQHHRAPAPVPARLWEQIVRLAARQGVTRTARALRLNAAEVKRAVAGQEAGPKFEVSDAANLSELFSEMGIAVAEPVHHVHPADELEERGELTVALESPDGVKMRIQARNVDPAVLLKLIQGFGGRC